MTQKQQIAELKELNQYLRFENLKMRLEFEVLVENINSKASQKILAKYRRKREIRDEAEKALRN